MTLEMQSGSNNSQAVGSLVLRIVKHPVTTAIEYVAATVFTLLYILGSTGPRYEEVFGVIIFTGLLGSGSLVLSLTNPRPIMNTVVYALLMLAGWVGCVWMVHCEYGYRMTDIPALRIGAIVSAVFCVGLFLINSLARSAQRAAERGRQPLATEALPCAR